jgi:hypothetical protein
MNEFEEKYGVVHTDEELLPESMPDQKKICEMSASEFEWLIFKIVLKWLFKLWLAMVCCGLILSLFKGLILF